MRRFACFLQRCVVVAALGLLCAAAAVAQTPQAAEATGGTAPAPVSSLTETDPLAGKAPTEDLADALNARGRYLLAIRVYEQLPPTASLENKLGIACLHMMMYDKARVSFETALKLNPKYSEVYNNLGTLAHSQGDLRTAEKMYRRSLKLNPRNPSTLQNLGTLYYAEHKFKKGDVVYKEALALDPETLEHSRNRGIPAQSKIENISEIHYHLAMTYAQAGSRKLAMDYLRQAISEGFHDRNRLLHDKEFADLRTTDSFLQLVDDLKNN